MVLMLKQWKAETKDSTLHSLIGHTDWALESRQERGPSALAAPTAINTKNRQFKRLLWAQ